MQARQIGWTCPSIGCVLPREMVWSLLDGTALPEEGPENEEGSQTGRTSSGSRTCPTADGLRRFPQAKPRTKATPPVPVRILVVEDQRLARGALELILTLDGYDVRVTGNGRRGIRTMQAFQPRLIIMDWHMPGLFGAELCREIRSRDPKVPIVIVSSSDEAFSNHVDANARLRMPVNVRQLRAVIRAQLSRSIMTC